MAVEMVRGYARSDGLEAVVEERPHYDLPIEAAVTVRVGRCTAGTDWVRELWNEIEHEYSMGWATVRESDLAGVELGSMRDTARMGLATALGSLRGVRVILLWAELVESNAVDEAARD